MLSIGKLSVGREGYYLDMLAASRDEYYLHPAETPGVWHGTLAGVLGLGGLVDPDAFRAVLAGCDPHTGEALVANAGRSGRVTGYDLTFSAPKSVSLLWALGDEQAAAAVADAHDRAVVDALDLIEAEAVMARRGSGGARRLPGVGLVGAGFGHRTSRAGDPQLHTHLVVANLTQTSDGHWSAPDGRLIYGWAKTVGYAYQAALRAQLTATLGVRWGPVTRGVAEIDGMSRAQRDMFSTRRAQIVAELDRLGYSSPAAAQTATLTTRPAKDHHPDLNLRKVWHVQADRVGLHVEDLARTVRTPAVDDRLADRLVGPEGLTAQATFFDCRAVIQAVAVGHPDGLPTSTVRDLASRVIDRPDVIALGEREEVRVLGRRYTTVELLDIEARLIAGAVARSRGHAGVATPEALARALEGRPTLSREQAAMIEQIVGSGAGVEIVVGRAGTGKTYALDAARAAWQASGYQVIGAALAARAAAGLQADAGIPATTIDRLLADLDRPGPLSGLTARSVVVVDEAGMVGTRKLDRLLDHAHRAGVKIVLAGDPHQLPEIDAGGTLAALTARLGAVELVDNRRQDEGWERAALDQLRSGTIADFVDAYRTHDRITLARSADGARQALVDGWWDARNTGVDTAMYALTRADVDDLNRRARTHLHARGLLGDDINIGGRQFALGDRVMCLRNDRRFEIRNGTTGTLTAFDTDHATVTSATITLPDGSTISLPSDYLSQGLLTHAYATTIHKAQGITVDEAFVLGSDQLYREAGYVGLSRARTSTRLYLVNPDPQPARDRLDDLAVDLQASRAQTLALDQHPHPAPVIDGAFRQPGPPTRAVAREELGVASSVDERDRRNVLLADPPAWALNELGPPPITAGLARDRWAETASRIVDYRERDQIVDDNLALGPRPLRPRAAASLGAVLRRHRPRPPPQHRPRTDPMTPATSDTKIRATAGKLGRRIGRLLDPNPPRRPVPPGWWPGLYLGAGRTGPVFAGPEHHALILGPPRSGKTSRLAVPNLRVHPGPAVVTSTKTDIAAATHPWRTALGTCWLWDPTGTIQPPPDVRPLRWSPVVGCQRWDSAVARAHALATAARPPQTRGSTDAHWVERAQALLAPLLHAAALNGGELAVVLSWLHRRQLLQPVSLLRDNGSAMAANILEGIALTEPRELSGIFSTTDSLLAAYRTDTALAATRSPDFDPDTFAASHDTAYLVAPTTAQDQHAPLVVCLLDQIRTAVYRQQPRPAMLWALDELAHIAPLPDLPATIAEGASQGLVIAACLQDLSQARARWGDRRRRVRHPLHPQTRPPRDLRPHHPQTGQCARRRHRRARHLPQPKPPPPPPHHHHHQPTAAASTARRDHRQRHPRLRPLARPQPPQHRRPPQLGLTTTAFLLSRSTRPDKGVSVMTEVASTPSRLLYTPVEAAAALGISRSSLYVLLSREAIASVRIGGSRRIPVAALDEFVESLQPPSSPTEGRSRCSWDVSTEAGQPSPS